MCREITDEDRKSNTYVVEFRVEFASAEAADAVYRMLRRSVNAMVRLRDKSTLETHTEMRRPGEVEEIRLRADREKAWLEDLRKKSVDV